MADSQPCPSCGAEVAATQTFCGRCGHQARERDPTALRRPDQTVAAQGTGEVCESCNAPLPDGSSIFCVECGARRTSTGERTGVLTASGWRSLRNKLEEAIRDDFEILDELGRGGMGAVYLAREYALDRVVAIKVLLPHLLTQPSVVERFRNEAQVVAALRHPAIVNIYTIGNHEDLHYFVMDFIPGATLQRIVRHHGPLPIDVVRAVLYQVGSALGYAHRQGRGVIHRDIKPSNIMLDTEGGAVVMDFGISKVLSRSSGFTMTGVVLGTPEYMSPEQCRGKDLTAASDQYALGLVAYTLLTASPPFTGSSYSVLLQHNQEEPVPVGEVRDDCPDDLADAVMRMLAKDASKRWPSITDALRAGGCRPVEHGDPVRERIGDLVREVAGDESSFARVAELSVTPPPSELYPGDAVELEAIAFDSLGKELRGRECEWSSSDPEVAAIGADGSLHILSEGRAVVIAECEGRREEVEIVVLRRGVGSIEIDAPRSVLRPGEAVELDVTVLDRRGEPMTDEEISWSTSDPSVVHVSPGGRVEAVGPGEAKVLARCQDREDAVTMEVDRAEVAEVDVSQPPGDVRPGDQFTLYAVARDSEGRELPEPIEWTSSDPDVLDVAPSGAAAAHGEGRAVLTASSGDVSSELEIVVRPARVHEVAISNPPQRIHPGDTFRLRAKLMDQRQAEIVGREVKWESSDTTVVTVLDPGTFKALREGRAWVTATSEGRRKSIPVSVAVRPTYQSAPVPDPDEAGSRRDPQAETPTVVAPALDAEGGPRAPARRTPTGSTGDRREGVGAGGSVGGGGSADGTERRDGPDRGWTSGPKLWIGLVAAAVLAVPLLWILLPDGASSVAEVSVLRNGAEVGSSFVLTAGESAELSATPLGADGNAVGDDVGWASSEPGVADVDRAGVVTALSPGTARITARSGDAEREILVEVQEGPTVAVGDTTSGDGEGVESGDDSGETTPPPRRATRVVVRDAGGDPVEGRIVLRPGERIDLDAEGVDDAGPIPDRAATFSSSALSVARVRPGGVIVAQGPGDAEISVLVDDAVRRIPVRVEGPPPPPPGTLRVLVRPWADVYVDGRLRAEGTQSFELDLPPGSYTVRLANPNLTDYETTVVVRSDDTTTVRQILREEFRP